MSSTPESRDSAPAGRSPTPASRGSSPAGRGSSPASGLESYRRKRDPAATPEPFGAGPVGAGESAAASRQDAAAAAGAADTPPRFVVQKHWARSLHYDFRLALDGVLKSWAVPRGPSTRAEEKRLAVHVEDHPLEYADFEGVIPKDNYGAGSVIVWDRGWFRSFKPEDVMDQYARGKMELELFGFKLRGRWTLVRMGRKENEWLLLKKADGAASEREAIDRYPESVITGLTVEEMRDVPGTVAALAERVAALGAPQERGDGAGRTRGTGARGRDGAPALMLATLADRPPEGASWCFEIKYDGVRVIARRDGDRVTLTGRSGEEISARYPEIAEALRALPVDRFTLDGEIIAEDEEGRPSFQRLQARMRLSRPRDVRAAMGRVPVRAVFFDCLALLGHDLRAVALEYRKELVARVVPRLGTVQQCEHVLGHGAAFFEAAAAMGLEGIVAKKLDSAYAGRRSPDWVKVKCQKRQEFVIGGWTEPRGTRAGFGALHVGLYEPRGESAGAAHPVGANGGDRLIYVTKVGSGFDEAAIADLMRRLEPLARQRSPFESGGPSGRSGHHWVEPRLVCEVRFTEWTRDGGLRHPIFLGLVADRRPEDCRREEPFRIDSGAGDPPAPAESPGPATAPAPAISPAPAKASRTAPERERVRLTNLRKRFWPDGYTKGDLIAYYESMAPLLLPYLRDRPLVLTRYPDGIEGKSFFQKDAPVFTPDWVRTETVYSSETSRDIRYFVVDDGEMLRYVANLGTIPLHVWGARVGSLDRPDWLILDLDPKGAPFTDVVKVARTLRTILDELGLIAYVKTSGATGLHILLPMGRRYTHEEVRTFARVLAMLVVEAAPDISTVTRAIRGRDGKVYVDFGQNGHGNTIVAPFSARPIAGAPASCPLRWDEVTARLDPSQFTIRTIPERFATMPDPMAPVLGEAADMVRAIERIHARMNGAPAGKPGGTGGETGGRRGGGGRGR